MTTIYLMRHSEGFKKLQGEMLTNDSVQLINEKNPLSVEGEKIAESFANKEEFKNLDIVYSSNYVRAMSTAKYFAFNNNIKVNIDERLKERVQGINSWNELPSDFEERQLQDENYKIGFGENQKEVRSRMIEAFLDILYKNKDKRVVIVSHATAITFLLKKWCMINNHSLIFNNKEFFDGNWDYCTCFKMIFNDNQLIDIVKVSR